MSLFAGRSLKVLSLPIFKICDSHIMNCQNDMDFFVDFSLENSSQESGLTLPAIWAGKLDFEDSLRIQNQMKDRIKRKAPRSLLLGFESAQPVISLGIRSDSSHILWPSSKLKKHNLSQRKVKRGGSATLHAPGQLVIYPMLSLPAFGLKVRDFIALLESITQDFLQDFGISTHKEGLLAGLWTKNGKMGFFGIHISEGVSCHGLSVNVDNDLRLFSALKSCGEAGRKHDKMSFYPQARGLGKRALFLKWREKAIESFSY